MTAEAELVGFVVWVRLLPGNDPDGAGSEWCAEFYGTRAECEGYVSGRADRDSALWAYLVRPAADGPPPSGRLITPRTVPPPCHGEWRPTREPPRRRYTARGKPGRY
jgi:hypothetical protein